MKMQIPTTLKKYHQQHFTMDRASEELVPYDHNGPTTEVLQIMKRVVASRSEKRYSTENTTFIFWINRNDHFRELLLEEWFLTKLDIAELNDAGKRSQPNMRKVCKEALAETNKSANNCPIILPSLTFNILSHYLTTRRNSSDGYLSPSSYNGIRSALTHIYRMSGQKMPDILKEELKHFMAGMKRTVASDRRANGRRLEEGKKPMTYEVYSKLCEFLWTGSDDEYLFAHAFLTMEWNLMARSDNCLHMNINHVQWRDDCLLFFFAKSKGNQGGENSENPWHVYSNPRAPHLCPVLALAKYVLSNPDILKQGCPLFPGMSQYERFRGIFNKVINKNQAVFRQLGVNPGDLGSHSTRKGAITLVSSGCTVSPPMASICLRACWSMGPVKERYIHYEKAGDQFCGRSVTGISSLTKEFAISPAHFDLESAPDNLIKVIDENIRMYMDESGGAVEGPKYLLIRYLFASICFHFEDLSSNLSPTNRLRSSFLFLAVTPEIRKYAMVKYPWNKTGSTPVFTGVPPQVVLMSEMEELKLNLEMHKDSILEGMRKELDNRHVGGDTYQANAVLEGVTEVHKKMVRLLESRSTSIQDEGTRNDLNIQNFINIDASDEQDYNETDVANGNNLSVGVDPNSPPRGVIVSWKNCEGGRIKLVSKNFQFPSMALPNLIRMWYCGDKNNNIPPYRMLSSCDVNHLKFGKQKLSNMKSLINHVERAARLSNQSHLIKKNWYAGDALILYNSVSHFFKFDSLRTGKRRRYETISWKTYYNILSKRKGKLYGEH